jgi:hypothetical protein
MASSIEAIKAKVQDVLPSRNAFASVSHITYVDTNVGADNETADGSEKKPYQSLSYAYIQTGNDKASYLTRQYVCGPVSADGDPSERLVWKEPAKSAVKKAQNAFDQHKKKLLKQQQVAAQEEEKEKARLKNLEDAKKVVIHENPSLPKAVKITTGDKIVELGKVIQKARESKLWAEFTDYANRSRRHSSHLSMGMVIYNVFSQEISPRLTMLSLSRKAPLLLYSVKCERS